MNSIENFLWHSRAAKYFSASNARRESFDSLRSVYLSINSRALCSKTWLKNCNSDINTHDESGKFAVWGIYLKKKTLLYVQKIIIIHSTRNKLYEI